MGWEDRDYYREGRRGAMSPLQWLMEGSVPLFKIFDIRVRMHASLVVVMALVVLLGVGNFGDSLALRVQTITALFTIILLHEFGHCFAARWTGGSANEILMTPLGGLAMAMARPRPWPTFVTVAGGPLVNVIICLLCGLGLYLTIGIWPLGPWSFGEVSLRVFRDNSLIDLVAYLFLFYGVSYALLLFNLLPIFPLDGGQLLQSILWKPLGYFRSMIIALNVGIVGSILLILSGIGLISFFGGGLLMAFIGLSCLFNCIRMRTMMRAEGPWAFTEMDSGFDAGGPYGGSVSYAGTATTNKVKGPGWLARRRAEKSAKQEVDEQAEIDTILAKVSAKGMQSLSWGEKRALRRATENQRKRDEEKRAARKRTAGL